MYVAAESDAPVTLTVGVPDHLHAADCIHPSRVDMTQVLSQVLSQASREQTGRKLAQSSRGLDLYNCASSQEYY